MSIDRVTKLRWRRRFRRKQRQVENLGVQAEEQLEQNFFKRLNHFVGVRRFMAAWVLLFGLLTAGVIMQAQGLSRYYQSIQPVPGGTYTEGVMGSFTNANPLYATGSVDAAVSRLVFSGLMKYDENNTLVGDLAAKLETDDKATVYTVRLKPNLQWHDGYPITAQDVIFTYKTIQNPDAKSPLLPNWKNVKIEAKDTRTIVFTLPHPLASFPYSLTNGIVPKHLLDKTSASQLRTISFNTANPVGSGPYKWEAVEVEGNTPETREERVGLSANEHYHEGAPKIPHFVVRAFHDEKRLLDSFAKQELTALAGAQSIPDSLQRNREIVEFNIPLSGEVMVFFRTNQEVLGDTKVRQALTHATNTEQIINSLGRPVIAADGPLLKSDIGYRKDIRQLPYNIEVAEKILNENGWKMGAHGIREKGGKPLRFRLFSQSNSEYANVAQALQRQWRAIGADVQVILQSESDLQSTLAFHNYDALLFGISLGTDPDVFAYWHSSQADVRSPNRLNFSEYKSATADRALEAGRARTETDVRATKYKPFLEAWRGDAPAIALYQPDFLYVTYGKIYNLDPKIINTPIERYSNVHNWMMRDAPQNIK
jgi:peptide/nickel transport system substrate-binding protein